MNSMWITGFKQEKHSLPDLRIPGYSGLATVNTHTNKSFALKVNYSVGIQNAFRNMINFFLSVWSRFQLLIIIYHKNAKVSQK